ncbi:sigma-70 family RNA polymerase sigma factor [Kitasatospora sp. NPDC059571]|uniref:sigma-70 family RNA polymerase sigma factor n=1 Tax=Kitasatospora sp. NPDC059571 TaxID=3346871 RepID=UPI0036C6A00D
MITTVTDAHRTIDAVWKLESARIVAALTRMVHDVGLAEELAQDALVAALEQWPATGVPDNPGAWLTAVAKRRAVDHIRRSRRLEERHGRLARELEHPPEAEQDDLLRLMFVSCHPVLPTDARVALTLRLLGGLTAAEIARAFLTAEPVIARRIAAAKRTLAEERIPFDLPAADELAGRLSSVLEVIYLIFNEGYAATSGDDLMRPSLCHEALRLGRLMAVLAPREAEVHGLVALMEIQASRSAARTGPSGEPVRLHEQNRGRWDRLLIRRGFTAMLRAREAGGPPGPYLLQAAIAVCHAQAATAEDTDWAQIATLYEALVRLLPTPVVRLNRAVAVGMAHGPAAGLALVDELGGDPRMQDYHLLPGVRGDLLLRLGRSAEARQEFERAAALAGNAAEQQFLRRRAEAIADPGPSGTTLGPAAEAFLARTDLDAPTLRSYGQTLRRLRRTLGDGARLDELTAERVAAVFATAWGTAAANTWNRHRAAVRSFGAWSGTPGLADGLDRRTVSRTPAAPIPGPQLAALWERPGAALRERTLWLLLHESGAAVGAALALDVQDLDLPGRRAGTGGTALSWGEGTARLLEALLAGRTAGPVFLADRRPGPARTPAAADLCPQTGRSRLSYERAEYLFKQATRQLDPDGGGYTLRRLRPRA